MLYFLLACWFLFLEAAVKQKNLADYVSLSTISPVF